MLPLLARLACKQLQIDTDLQLMTTSTADELSGGTNINDIEWLSTGKIGVFGEFFAIFNGVRFDPLFKESSVRAHQIWVPPWKRAISATVVQSSMRMVADRHRLAAHHNKHCWRAFRGYQHRWHRTTSNPKNRGCSEFLAILGCSAHLESKFSLKYTGDRPRQTAYEIILMLSRISWALAQISCW